MNLYVIIFLLITSVGVFCSGRRLAAIFFLLGILYLTKGAGLQIGGTMLHPYRLLLLVGVIRVFVRNEKSQLQVVFVDKLVLGSVFWLLFLRICFTNRLPARESFTTWVLDSKYSLLIS